MSPLSKEDEYFLAREIEVRAKIRADLEEKARAALEHRDIADHVGITDKEVASRIRGLGFVGEAAKVLHLMPLVEVAWADGTITDAERTVILSAARSHGVEPGTNAGTFLASLLEKRPSNLVLEEILKVLKLVLAARGHEPMSVIDACVAVAEASGGFLGFGNRISGQEKEMIKRIAATFGEGAKRHVEARLR